MKIKELIKSIRNNKTIKHKNGYVSIADIPKMGKSELSNLYQTLFDRKIALEKSKSLFNKDDNLERELNDIEIFLEMIEIVAEIITEEEEKEEKMKKLRELEKLAEQKKIESLDYKSIMKEIEKLKKEL